MDNNNFFDKLKIKVKFSIYQLLETRVQYKREMKELLK
jgi:hypothetical protein